MQEIPSKLKQAASKFATIKESDSKRWKQIQASRQNAFIAGGMWYFQDNSYLETLALIALDLGANRTNFETVHLAANENTVDVIGILVKWANEFEQLHLNTLWGNAAEWYEEIEKFMTEKIEQLKE